MRTLCFVTLLALLGQESPISAADAKPSLELKIIAKKDVYTLDRGGKSAAEYKKMIDDIISIKGNRFAEPPQPPAVDLVLEIKNTGKEAATIIVQGDANLVTLDLKGPATHYLAPRLAFTRDFRLGMEIVIQPGKSFDMPIKQLTDGFRGVSRYIYWMEAGEYTLGATYQLAGPDGAKGPILKAEPIKIKVEDKK